MSSPLPFHAAFSVSAAALGVWRPGGCAASHPRLAESRAQGEALSAGPPRRSPDCSAPLDSSREETSMGTGRLRSASLILLSLCLAGRSSSLTGWVFTEPWLHASAGDSVLLRCLFQDPEATGWTVTKVDWLRVPVAGKQKVGQNRGVGNGRESQAAPLLLELCMRIAPHLCAPCCGVQRCALWLSRGARAGGSKLGSVHGAGCVGGGRGCSAQLAGLLSPAALCPDRRRWYFITTATLVFLWAVSKTGCGGRGTSRAGMALSSCRTCR